MPTAAKRPCAQPGCGALVARGYCHEHAQASRLYDKHRGTAARRGYDAAWQRAKNEALDRDEHLCQPCKLEGKLVRATEVDHIEELADGGARLDKKNLLSVCHSHHMAKTWQQRRVRSGGGRGNPQSLLRR